MAELFHTPQEPVSFCSCCGQASWEAQILTSAGIVLSYHMKATLYSALFPDFHFYLCLGSHCEKKILVCDMKWRESPLKFLWPLQSCPDLSVAGHQYLRNASWLHLILSLRGIGECSCGFFFSLCFSVLTVCFPAFPRAYTSDWSQGRAWCDFCHLKLDGEWHSFRLLHIQNRS